MDRKLIRDSGVHQPDESLAEEDPNITIREGDNSSDSSSVTSHLSNNDMPDNDPPAQVRQALIQSTIKRHIFQLAIYPKYIFLWKFRVLYLRYRSA